jgi:hypothetical protein
MKVIVTTALVAFLLSPAVATAQAPAPRPPVVDDPEATLLSDLLVVAPTQGPAWWRVSKGDSVVWIMGLPENPGPKNMKWDRKALDRRLTGARVLLTPPIMTLAFPASAKGNSAGAPPALADRFSTVRTRIGKSARRYADSSPAVALLTLYRDYLKSAKLEGGEALRWTHAMAKARRVPIVQPTKIQAQSVGLAELDPARPEAAACYEALMQATEVPVERYRSAAAGWARGDLRAAASAPRNPFGVCENRLFNQGASRRAIAVQVAAIEAALKEPGKAVAVASIRALVADEGILVRLAAKGYDIVYPTALDANAD